MPRRNDSRDDLNLLFALDVLLEERSATRAAARLGVTQSAVSRMLARLRATFRDPLFVRTARGLTPTRRALALAGPLRQAVGELQRLVAEEAPFEPALAERSFRIAAVDYAQVVLLAPLLARLAREAPRVDFEVRQPSGDSERDLEAGALDILLMPRQPSGPAIVWTPLHRAEYACLVWRGHRLRRIGAAAFAEMPHVLVTPRERPGGGVVDEVLAEQRRARRVAVRVPTFLMVPYLLIGTGRIATVPARIATELARRHPLRVLRPPLRVPPFTLCQAWHEVHRQDPGHRWLRDQILRADREAPARARR
ncbi:MAG TPA: LysR substrate-binding domain-containing protein [Candidatus Binatia bacterium]|nr:LysR substrate-binding domain-containing protein [Candidatus Binatia bacterium]